ncbi:hypothetical protein [Methylobacterium aquaticum]|uniref:hypothetical protein n=1 Tax=Methylobacterium aquaticum TaxID=270351 RepID=UPI00193277DB|nr:hypothetical protein [Methylobacterium aquaticum]QRE75397.1 hypothetical protein F1D61_18990 [Methylobacterium aquaticum]
MRFAIPLVLACGLAAPALAQSGRPPALLIHGNYCGPGNNAPLPPIDALDAACARHDACTPRGGLASAACNARLQREATLISRDPHQPRDLRDAAGFVAFAAGMMPARSQVAAAPGIPSVAAPSFAVPSIDVPSTGSVAPAIEEDDDE